MVLFLSRWSLLGLIYAEIDDLMARIGIFFDRLSKTEMAIRNNRAHRWTPEWKG